MRHEDDGCEDGGESVPDEPLPSDHLVDRVYAALLGEASWQSFLTALYADIPGRRGTLFYFDAAAGRGLCQMTTGMSQCDEQAFGEHYSRVNPFMPSAVLRPIDLGVVSQAMCPQDVLRRTEFYNDYMRPMGARAAVGVTVVKQKDRRFFLTALTDRDDADENRRHADRLQIVSPHLRRAFSFYAANAHRDAIGTVGTSILDAAEIGTVVVGEDRRPVSISAYGSALAESGAVVRTRGACFRLADRSLDEILGQMVSRGYEGPRSISRMCGPARITLVRVQRDSAVEVFQGPLVVILVEPVFGTPTPADARGATAAFGLTKTEGEILVALLEGATLNDIANRRGVSVETVRSQAKSIYAKTGTSGRSELSRRVRTASLRV